MMNKLSNRGFTLIEVGIALVVIGVITVAILQLQKVTDDRKARFETEQRMARVVQSIADYVEIANRVPCPADPADGTAAFGYERGVTLAMMTPSRPRPMGNCDTAAESEGIVPFQTLGLGYDQILDGWGRPMTYAVSPVFAQDSDLSDDNLDRNGNGNFDEAQDADSDGTPDEQGVHVYAMCRTPRWIDDDNNNANVPKAIFCCAGERLDGTLSRVAKATDLRIVAAGTNVIPPRIDGTDSRFDLVTEPYAPASDPAGNPNYNVPRTERWGDEIAAPAFVLVSHGANGRGAYLANDTNGRYRAALLTGLELQNANGDATFALAPRSRTFDDVIYWQTQYGIMAYNGVSSCLTP
jgi:prepilin-type N-terminal cleavage/methylation domain-containing protein